MTTDAGKATPDLGTLSGRHDASHIEYVTEAHTALSPATLQRNGTWFDTTQTKHYSSRRAFRVTTAVEEFGLSTVLHCVSCCLELKHRKRSIQNLYNGWTHNYRALGSLPCTFHTFCLAAKDEEPQTKKGMNTKSLGWKDGHGCRGSPTEFLPSPVSPPEIYIHETGLQIAVREAIRQGTATTKKFANG